MRILYLDQALQRTGYCISEDKTLIESGVLENKNYEKEDRLTRLISMSNLIENTFLSSRHIDYIILEGIQYRKNADVFMQLARLQGMIFSLVDKYGIGCLIVYPSEWKSCLSITSKKSKDQKKETVNIISQKYPDIFSGQEDEADAIGIFEWIKKNWEIS